MRLYIDGIFSCGRTLFFILSGRSSGWGQSLLPIYNRRDTCVRYRIFRAQPCSCVNTACRTDIVLQDVSGCFSARISKKEEIVILLLRCRRVFGVERSSERSTCATIKTNGITLKPNFMDKRKCFKKSPTAEIDCNVLPCTKKSR